MRQRGGRAAAPCVQHGGQHQGEGPPPPAPGHPRHADDAAGRAVRARLRRHAAARRRRLGAGANRSVPQPARALADLSGGGSGATRRCPPSALSTSCPRSPTPATSSATSATPRPAGGKGWWGRGCACRHRRAPSRTVAHRRAAAGLGRYVDTNRFRVLSASNLGGPFGTTSPVSEEPGTGRPYRLRFPQITPGDVARVHHRLMQQVSASRHATRAMLRLLPRTFIAESPCGVGSSAGLGEGARGHRLQHGGDDCDSLRVYFPGSRLQAGGHGMHRSDISSAPPARHDRRGARRGADDRLRCRRPPSRGGVSNGVQFWQTQSFSTASTGWGTTLTHSQQQACGWRASLA